MAFLHFHELADLSLKSCLWVVCSSLRPSPTTELISAAIKHTIAPIHHWISGMLTAPSKLLLDRRSRGSREVLLYYLISRECHLLLIWVLGVLHWPRRVQRMKYSCCSRWSRCALGIAFTEHCHESFNDCIFVVVLIELKWSWGGTEGGRHARLGLRLGFVPIKATFFPQAVQRVLTGLNTNQFINLTCTLCLRKGFRSHFKAQSLSGCT